MTKTIQKTIITPSTGTREKLRDIWQTREVFYSLLIMEHQVRYRQTMLGVAWAVLQPVVAMAIFTMTFGYVAKFSSEGLPYSLFALTGLVVWYYMFNSIQHGSMSVIESAELIRQVSFPRAYFPLSVVVSKLFDFFIALVFLGLYALIVHPFHLTPFLLLAPVYCLLGVLCTSGVVVGLAGLCAQFRDIKFIVPYLTQLLFFSTPIVYVVPNHIYEKYPFVVWLNPFTIWIMGFRQSLFSEPGFDHTQNLEMLCAWTIVIMTLGYRYFFRIEKYLPDRV